MLALVGSGEYLPPMEPVDRFLLSRLEDPLRVVCLLLLVPLLPFLVCGPQLEALFRQWLLRWTTPAQTAALMLAHVQAVFFNWPSSSDAVGSRWRR